MSDLPRHQDLKCVFGPGVIAEVDQPFVDDFRPSFGSDITAEINIEFTRDFQVVSRPCVSHRIEQADATSTSTRDRDEWINLSGFPTFLHGLEVHAGEGAHDL